MSRKILFNGAILYRPGAYTRIDASAFNTLGLTGVGICGLVGEADGGEPSVVKVFADAESAKNFYRSGPLVEAANLLISPSADPRIPGGATGIVCVKVNQSVQASLQTLTGPNNSILFESRDYGEHTNLTSLAISAGPSTGRVLTIRDKSSAQPRTEVSPELGVGGKFTAFYTGAGASALTTISPTALVITTGVPADDVNISFLQYKTLADVLAKLTQNPNYIASSLVANADSFDPANLDYVAAVDIKVASPGVTFYSRNFDIADWVNTNSSILEATRSAGAFPIGATWPDNIVETALAGGLRGTSSNSTWVAAFATLGTVDANQVIPLCSQNGSVYGMGDTYTFASVAAAAEAHARFYSSTVGKSERQAWIGGALSKANLIAEAVALNSEHACLWGQQVLMQFVDGEIAYGEEYFGAVILAGMRAGAPLGEPLTWKFMNVDGVTVRDGSWNPDNDTDSSDLITNGVIYARNVPNRGTRIERGLTTFLKFENDAFTEESIVQGWKLISRRFRAVLEDTYTGTRALLSNIGTVIPVLRSEADRLREEGQIADSVLADGTVVPGFREAKVRFAGGNISVSAVVSPVEGINFETMSIFLVPSTINL